MNIGQDNEIKFFLKLLFNNKIIIIRTISDYDALEFLFRCILTYNILGYVLNTSFHVFRPTLEWIIWENIH